MKAFLQRWGRLLSSKQGSSTMEYIIVIAAGALLATLLMIALSDTSIQQELKAKVIAAITGEPQISTNNSTPDESEKKNHPSVQTQPPAGNPPQSPPRKCTNEGKVLFFTVQFPKCIEDGFSFPTIATGNQFVDKYLDLQLNGWVGDANYLLNDPTGYLSEVFGWEDIKSSWNKLTSDPLGYVGDIFDNTVGQVKEIVNDPGKFALDIVGWYDLKSWWTGKDSDTGEDLTMVNRTTRLLSALPLPTKALKVIPYAKNIFFPDGCSCPTANNNPKPKKDKPKLPDTNHPDMGKVEVGPDGKRYVYDIFGEKHEINGWENTGKTITVQVDGRNVNVTYDQNGFPDFTPSTAYESKLDRDDWFKSDDSQFSKLSKELHDKMQDDPNLKRRIDDQLMNTLENGNGAGNGASKMKAFLNGNKKLKDQLTSEDISRLESGEGLTQATMNRIKSDPQLKDEFLKANHNWIKKGRIPVGFVWNHHQEPGRMQLVEHKVHAGTPHTGGRRIWGGGR